MNNQDQKLWTFHQTDNVDNLIVGHPRQDLIYKKITKFIKSGKVLEIGFGDGYLLKKLSQKYTCYGADISHKNVEQMKKNIPNVNFEILDMDGKLPYENEFFDGFIASEVLEHMTDEELDCSMNEIIRVLKSGGYAIVTFPVKENIKDSECFCPECGVKFHKWGHKQVWNEEKIAREFNKFKIIQKKEIFIPFKGNSLMENLIGTVMFAARNILNIFINVPNKTYFVILEKE